MPEIRFGRHPDDDRSLIEPVVNKATWFRRVAARGGKPAEEVLASLDFHESESG